MTAALCLSHAEHDHVVILDVPLREAMAHAAMKLVTSPQLAGAGAGVLRPNGGGGWRYSARFGAVRIHPADVDVSIQWVQGL